MKDILIKDMYKDRVVLAYINSDDELEYTEYVAVDGGVLVVDDTLSEDTIASILVSEVDITEYIDYTLEEIE